MNKIISIHQPQYIPWLPYFSKILSSDCFVILDQVSFQKNGLQNRNQIKTAAGKLWLTIPVIHSFGQAIKDTRIANDKIFSKHLKTLEMNYQKAPYFSEIWSLLHPIFSKKYTFLSELNITLIIAILNFLKYDGKICLGSSMNITGKKSELIRNICNAKNIGKYLSGQGGKNYLDFDDFKKNGIEIIFHQYLLREYPQLHNNHPFLNNLSIIDLLFNTGKSAKNYLLNEKSRA